MERIIDALTAAGISIERVVDAGTLAYMITDGDLESFHHTEGCTH